MTTQSEAERLAERLDLYVTGDAHQRDIEQAAAELRRLHVIEVEHKKLSCDYQDTWDSRDKALTRLNKALTRLTEAERVMKLAMEALESRSEYEGNSAITALSGWLEGEK